MTTVVTIHCDNEDPYGTCARRSLPGRTADEARQLADADGWLLKPDRDLCPGCCGGKRRTPPRSTVISLRH